MGELMMNSKEFQIINSLNDAIVLIDANRKIIHLNTKAEEITGFTTKEAKGKSCFDVLNIELCKNGCPIDEVVSKEYCINNFDVNLKSRDGKSIQICLNTTPLKDASGEIIGIIDNIRVIDHVKTIITDLDDEKMRIEAILNSLDEGVYTINTEWKITSLNKTAERITGFSEREVIGKICSDVFDTPLCRNSCPLKRLLTDKESVRNVNSSLTGNNGNDIPIILNMALFTDKHQNVLGGVTSFWDVRALEAQVESHTRMRPTHGIVGDSPKIKSLLDLIATAAKSDVNVLVTGESGTGKNLVAKAIHFSGARKDGPFIKVNMSAIPETLIESELYGHVKGAFTGADRNNMGKFEIAQGGTLFLDEISEMSIHAQAKLLQVIQDKEFYPVGGNVVKNADVRIIAATNTNLYQEITEKRFREDLYFRLNVFPIAIPPLRDRIEDIPIIIHHILEKLLILYGDKQLSLSPGLLETLCQYNWPGNIRELENVLEYGFLCTDGNVITDESVANVLGGGAAAIEETKNMTMESPEAMRTNKEREQLLKILSDTGWNKKETSKVLGVDRTTLWRRMKKYGI
jgi:PAS domain S-box-containing protein